MLLVHGAWQGAWCWDPVADRLRSRGHDVRTVTLRGHDNPPGRIWYRISDYVDDVRAAVRAFAAPPIVVGHSMGGLVVQKYLERHPAAAAVLLAPVPTGGALGATIRFARRHPLAFLKTNVQLRLRPIVGTPALAREMLFAPEAPADIADAYYPRWQDESYVAYLGMIASLPRPRRVNVPILVLIGDRDRIFTVREARRTAEAYGTNVEVFPGRGHQMMLEPGWEAVADRNRRLDADIAASQRVTRR